MDMYCIVYDVTNRNSFKNCAMWLEQLSQSRGDHNIFGKKSKFVLLSFVMNKFSIQVFWLEIK